MQRKFLRYSLSALAVLAIVSLASGPLLAQTKGGRDVNFSNTESFWAGSFFPKSAGKAAPPNMATKTGPQQKGEQDYFVRMWNQPAGGIQIKIGSSGVPTKSNAAAKYGGFYESFVIKGKNSNPTSSAPKKRPVENIDTVIQGSRIRF